MISVTTKGIEQLKRSLGDQAKRLPREVATAINATAKVVKRAMAKEVTEELAVAQKVVIQTLSEPRKANAQQLAATVRLSKTKRPSLKEFGARQTQRGTTYKVSKSEGRKTIAGAFMGGRPGEPAARLGGHVFKRAGKARLPIVKLYGASPFGVFVKRQASPRIVVLAERELEKQIERRIRFNVLKSQGAI